MKSKVYLVEILQGNELEVFIVRDGKGSVKQASPNVEEFLNYLRNSEEIDAEKEAAADCLEKDLDND